MQIIEQIKNQPLKIMLCLDRGYRKIKNKFIDNGEDIDVIISMYNLLEYISNFSNTSGSLWNHHRGELNDPANENIAPVGYRMNSNKTATSKSFEHKKKIIIGKEPINNNTLNIKVAVSLKYLSTLRRSFDLPLINCEIENDLSWLEDCLISEISKTPEVPANSAANLTTDRVPPT